MFTSTFMLNFISKQITMILHRLNSVEDYENYYYYYLTTMYTTYIKYIVLFEISRKNTQFTPYKINISNKKPTYDLTLYSPNLKIHFNENITCVANSNRKKNIVKSNI